MAREYTAGLLFHLENLGFIINYPKSLLTPTQELNFLGFVINSADMQTRRKNQADMLRRKKTSGCKKKVPICTNPVLSARPTEPCTPGHSPKAAVLQEPANLSQGCSRNQESGLLQPSTANSCSNGRITMVAIAPYHLEWAVPSDTKPRFGDRDRCLKHRLGRPLSGCQNRRTSVKDQDTPTHKLFGATSSNASCQMLRQREDIHIHLKSDNTTTLTYMYINKFGGRVSPELNQLTKELWLWCLHKNISLQATHLAGTKNITADEESRVMKDRSDRIRCPEIFDKINTILGPLQVHCTPVCLQINPPIPKLPVCELETRPRSYGNKCLHPRLDTVPRVCEPPMEFDQQGTISGQEPEGSSGTCDSNMEVPSMVPNPPGEGSTNAPHSPKHSNPDHANSLSQQARHNTTTSRMG